MNTLLEAEALQSTVKAEALPSKTEWLKAEAEAQSAKAEAEAKAKAEKKRKARNTRRAEKRAAEAAQKQREAEAAQREAEAKQRSAEHATRKQREAEAKQKREAEAEAKRSAKAKAEAEALEAETKFESALRSKLGVVDSAALKTVWSLSEAAKAQYKAQSAEWKGTVQLLVLWTTACSIGKDDTARFSRIRRVVCNALDITQAGGKEGDGYQSMRGHLDRILRGMRDTGTDARTYIEDDTTLEHFAHEIAPVILKDISEAQSAQRAAEAAEAARKVEAQSAEYNSMKAENEKLRAALEAAQSAK